MSKKVTPGIINNNNEIIDLLQDFIGDIKQDSKDDNIVDIKQDENAKQQHTTPGFNIGENNNINDLLLEKNIKDKKKEKKKK